MISLDVPEMLIVLAILAALAWAGYNWTHRGASPSK
jgi:prepilin-type N-terminal cleavage/methylation domain-containing protein